MSNSSRNSGVGRRSFLARSALATGAVRLRGMFSALVARGPQHPRSGRGPSPDYGPLEPAIDETTGLPLLLLPNAFRYLSFGWTGDPISGGLLTPAAHDGMAAFPAGHGRVLLVRNHEIGEGPDAFAPALAYDPEAGGGTVTLEFDTLRGRVVDAWASISGTVRNCAGGATPWGSWLTCEETTIGVGTADLTQPHGYILEVPATGTGNPIPYKEMGRFSHEAIAVDPLTGYIYETEDAGGNSGFYRFRPNRPGVLSEGGVLEMLAISGAAQHDTRTNQDGEWRDVEWHVIDVPDPAVPSGTTSVFSQGFAQGSARFGRLEAALSGNSRIYFVSTNGRDAGQGQFRETDAEHAETLPRRWLPLGAGTVRGGDDGTGTEHAL